MTKMTWIKRCAPAAAILVMTSGCVHDAYYLSAKDRDYNIVPAFANSKITANSWVDEEDRTSARYTSSNMVTHERYHSSVIGNLYIKNSDDPNAESTVFAVRRENRAYSAETPIFDKIQFGDREITPNFSIGHHRDHKVMAGLTFRMPF